MVIRPAFFFRPDEPVAGGEPPAAPAVEPAALPDAPWAKDRDTLFADPASRTAFDTYMRTTAQPYTTKLEQDKADLAERAAWFDDLNADPDAVLRDAIEQTYGADKAQEFAALIAAGVAPEAAAEEVVPAKAELDPEDRAAIDYAKDRRAKDALAEYMAEVDALIVEHPHVAKDAFHLYVKEHGDLAEALTAYNAHFPPPAKEEPPAPTAPATLGGGGTVGGTATAIGSLNDLGAALFAAAAPR